MRAPGATPSVIRRASRLLYAGRLLGTVDPARTDPPGRQTRIALDHLEAHREAIMRHMEERKAAIKKETTALKLLIEAKTVLTQKALTEKIEALTREIHARLPSE